MNKKPSLRIKDFLTAQKPCPDVLVLGWVRTRRDSKGGFSFLEVNDGSCLKNLQIVIDHKLESFQQSDKNLTTGSCVRIRGDLEKSQGKGQAMEVQATEVHVYGPADPEKYPLQKTFHSLEYLREIPNIRQRPNHM